MKYNRRLQGLMTDRVLLLRLNVTVQLVKGFIRFCACELIMCVITALEVEGPDVLLATGMGFAVLFFSEMAHCMDQGFWSFITEFLALPENFFLLFGELSSFVWVIAAASQAKLFCFSVQYLFGGTEFSVANNG